jgi:hypothetical protein
MFYAQSYLRYIYPALSIIFFVSIFLLSKTKINQNILMAVLGVIISINFIKSSLASSAFRPMPLSFYMSNEGRLRYLARHFPFAPIGEMLRIFPEFSDKKILLVGYGVDPMYYHFPKSTAAYSWHSLRYFDSINQANGSLDAVIKKESIEFIVCPNIQHADDKFKFSEQCKKISYPLIVLDNVYVGKINNAAI